MKRASVYRERAARFREESAVFRKKYGRLSWLRALLFLSAMALIIYLFSVNPLIASLSLAPLVAVLGLFVHRHEAIAKKSAEAARMAEINEEEALRLQGKGRPVAEGSSYINPEHPYSSDLDLFGPGSLYAYLCRAHTPHGRELLAAYLQSPADPEEIKSRQESVAELAEKLDYRQEIFYYGEKVNRSPSELEELARWGKEEARAPRSFLFHFLRFAYPAVALTALALSLTGSISGWYPLLLFFGAFPIIGQFKKAIEKNGRVCTGNGETLKMYEGIFNSTARHAFQSADLQKILSVLGEEAADGVRKLALISEAFEARKNALVSIFGNGFLMRDLQLLHRAEKWHRLYGPHLGDWFLLTGRLEALASMANLFYNRPSFIFPEFIAHSHQIELRDAGHPLIDPEKCVTNDLKIEKRGQIQLITGSNMAGKSTYLRTIGVNIVLAQAGSAIMAGKAKLTPTHLISSMRNADALNAGISSFYAELLRLKRILDDTRKNTKTFFLIDEILKGTNSMDRHKGSVALVKQLLKSGGRGLISTHDLELAEKAKQMEGIENFSFEVDIRNGKLFFDYKKHPGICRSLNASILMKEMGIEVDEEEISES